MVLIMIFYFWDIRQKCVLSLEKLFVSSFVKWLVSKKKLAPEGEMRKWNKKGRKNITRQSLEGAWQPQPKYCPRLEG